MKEDVKMKLRQKKKIALREYHKKRMVTGIAILVTEIFEKTAEHYKLDNTTWATVIFVVLAAMTALFAVIWLYASCQKVDKEDEMAKENMLKAHQSITKMFFDNISSSDLYINVLGRKYNHKDKQRQTISSMVYILVQLYDP